MNQLMNDVRSVGENMYVFYFQRALHQAFTVGILQRIKPSTAVSPSDPVVHSFETVPLLRVNFKYKWGHRYYRGVRQYLEVNATRLKRKTNRSPAFV